MVEQLKKIFDTNKKFDLNKEAIRLKKTDKLFSLVSSNLVMLEDAKIEKKKIFKLKKPFKSKTKIPIFIF